MALGLIINLFAKVIQIEDGREVGEAYHFYRCQSICLANLFPLLTPFHFKFVTRALCPISAGLLNLLINVVISFQKLDALCLTNWQMVLYPQQIRTQALPELRRR